MPRLIEIRPYRNGWQCFEGPGVAPFWIGDDAKNQAVGYAKERAKTDGSEIRILNEAGEVAKTLRFNVADFQDIVDPQF